MQPNKDEVAGLRENIFVKAWIEEHQKGVLFRPHPDCRLCGWPHSPHLLCGSGSTFGLIRLGGYTFAIDASNVEYMVDFVTNKLGPGFHWKNEIYWDVRGDKVIVSHIEQYNNCPSIKKWEIPMREWQSIADFVLSKAAPASERPAMIDRLDRIEGMLNEGLTRGPDDNYYRILLLVLEELKYLRAENAHAKNAAQEFARLMP